MIEELILYHLEFDHLITNISEQIRIYLNGEDQLEEILPIYRRMQMFTN
jgi:hypothetical protein